MQEKTQYDKLLEIIAISGEFPVQSLNRIINSKSYSKKITTALISEKLIKLCAKDHKKGYRLTPKSKRKLLSENRERFSSSLQGGVETNLVTRQLKVLKKTVAYRQKILYSNNIRHYKKESI